MTAHIRIAALVYLTCIVLTGCPKESETTAADDTGASEVIVIDQGQTDGGLDDTGDQATADTIRPGRPDIGETTQSECTESVMTVGETIAAGCIQAPPESIEVGPTTQAACEGESSPFITGTAQSECTDEVAIGRVTIEPCEEVGDDLADEISLIPGPGRFELTHVNATFNCCGLVEMEAAMVEGVLVITENQVYDDEHEACRCNCEFTLHAPVTGLTGGTYTVRVVNGGTDEPYDDDMEVTVSAPESGFSARGGAGRIDLQHLNAEHNCCVDVAMRFSQAELNIKVWEVEAGEPCDCRCTFDLATSIRELPAGTYSVQLLDGEAGSAVGDPVEVTVTEMEDTIEVDVFEDTLTIRHNNAEWNCCGVVDMDVTLIGNRVRVEETEAFPEGSPCRCNCNYDLSVVASGFAPGSYLVEVFTGHEDGEEVFGSVDVIVPGSPSDSDGAESVSATSADDNTIAVVHNGATYNCCSVVEMTATREGTDIAVQEVITNDELCRCTCDFALSTTLSNLEPDTYTVTVTGADGAEAGSATVDVRGGLPVPAEEVVIERSGTTVAIHHTGAPFNCCSEVEAEIAGSGDVVEVIEKVINLDDLCDCECVFDIDTSITGLDAELDYHFKMWRYVADGDWHLVTETVLPAE